MLRVIRWNSAARNDHGQARVPAALRPPLRAKWLDNSPLDRAESGEVVNVDDLSQRDGVCVDTTITIRSIYIHTSSTRLIAASRPNGRHN